jgi:hypothetical protein
MHLINAIVKFLVTQSRKERKVNEGSKYNWFQHFLAG